MAEEEIRPVRLCQECGSVLPLTKNQKATRPGKGFFCDDLCSRLWWAKAGKRRNPEQIDDEPVLDSEPD